MGLEFIRTLPEARMLQPCRGLRDKLSHNVHLPARAGHLQVCTIQRRATNQQRCAIMYVNGHAWSTLARRLSSSYMIEDWDRWWLTTRPETRCPGETRPRTFGSMSSFQHDCMEALRHIQMVHICVHAPASPMRKKEEENTMLTCNWRAASPAKRATGYGHNPTDLLLYPPLPSTKSTLTAYQQSRRAVQRSSHSA